MFYIFSMENKMKYVKRKKGTPRQFQITYRCTPHQHSLLKKERDKKGYTLSKVIDESLKKTIKDY